MIVMGMQGARWIKLGSRLVLPSLFGRKGKGDGVGDAAAAVATATATAGVKG